MKFIACDLVTGDVLEEVPLELGQDLTYQLKGPGDTVLRAPYWDNQGREALPFRYWENLVVPQKTLICLVDGPNDDIVWGGTPTDRQRGLKASYAGFPTQTLESYLTRRYMPTMHYVNVDQAYIVRSMVALANDQGINFQVDAPNTGILRERHYLDEEQARIGDRLNDLSNVTNGFDWRVDLQWSSTDHRRVDKVLRIGYPWLGNRTAYPEHEFRLGVNVTDALLDERWGQGDAATAVKAIGDGDGENRLQSSLGIDSALEAAGWPRLEERRSYTGVTDRPTIEDHRRRLESVMFGGQRVVTLEARNPGSAEKFTRLSDIRLGDTGRVVIKSDQYVGFELDEVWPITGWTLAQDMLTYRPTLANIARDALNYDTR